MNHLLAVGKVTDKAVEKIQDAGGQVIYVSDVPGVMLVSLPNVSMEYMESETEMRLKLNGSVPLIWRGHYPGPWMTSVDQTELCSEYEPVGEPVDDSDDELGDLDGEPVF